MKPLPQSSEGFRYSKTQSLRARKLNSETPLSRQRRRRGEFATVLEAVKKAYPRMARRERRNLVFPGRKIGN